MKKNLYSIVSIAMLLAFTFFQNTAIAQVNILVNPSFEDPIQGNSAGNNTQGSAATIPGWSKTGTFPQNEFNIIRLDPHPAFYNGGPNSPFHGDQYLDLVGNPPGRQDSVLQSFTTGCSVDLSFGGRFSSREANVAYVNFDAKIEIVSGTTIIATSSIKSFDPLVDADGTAVPDAIWYPVSGTITGLAAGTYTYRIIMNDFVNFDSAYAIITPGCLLPVNLKSFDAKVTDCAASINWNVDGESKFNKYIIEYSENGVDYKEVGTVQGQATENASKSYSYKHLPAAGVSYYRLKMVDNDGSFSYSKIVTVRSNCDKEAILVFPNPVSDVLKINFKKTSTTASYASLYDITGRLVTKQLVTNGTNTVDMSRLPSGMYNLVVVSNDEVNSFKVNKN